MRAKKYRIKWCSHFRRRYCKVLYRVLSDTVFENITHFSKALFECQRKVINKTVRPDEADRPRNRIFE